MTIFISTATNYNITLLQPIRQWLDSIEIHNPKLARLLCKLIPTHCPFEREIKLFDHTVLCIPLRGHFAQRGEPPFGFAGSLLQETLLQDRTHRTRVAFSCSTSSLAVPHFPTARP